jgi:hypothetical protein
MPRPKVDQDWVTVIYTLKANEPKLGARAILTKLQKARKDAGISEKCPGLRTVGRYLKEWPGLPEEERRLYRDLYWPESFERGDLPWEASAAALELIQVWGGGPRLLMISPEARRHLTPSARPSVRLARWFWHVTQAAPGAPAFERRHVAGWLAAAEAVGSDVRRVAEDWLWYAPWRSEEAQAAYEKALADGTIPPFEFVATGGAKEDALWELAGGHKFGGGRWVDESTGESGDLTEEESRERFPPKEES